MARRGFFHSFLSAVIAAVLSFFCDVFLHSQHGNAVSWCQFCPP